MKKQDFVAIGCFLGVEAFTGPGADDMIVSIRRALGSAQRKDAIAKKNDKYVTKQLKAMLSGKTGSNTSMLSASGAFAQVVQSYMDDFRRKYADVVIRRTVNSKDYLGEPISGLPPYQEQVVMCVLTEKEHETFREVVQALAEKAESVKGIRGAVSDIYMSRRGRIEAAPDVPPPALLPCATTVFDAPLHPWPRTRLDGAQERQGL